MTRKAPRRTFVHALVSSPAIKCCERLDPKLQPRPIFAGTSDRAKCRVTEAILSGGPRVLQLRPVLLESARRFPGTSTQKCYYWSSSYSTSDTFATTTSYFCYHWRLFCYMHAQRRCLTMPFVLLQLSKSFAGTSIQICCNELFLLFDGDHGDHGDHGG